VLAAGTPVSRTPLTSGRPDRPALRQRVGSLLVLRRPQAAAREPLHHRIGMPDLELPQRRHQLFLRVRAKRGGLAFENDRPVVVPGRHAAPIMAALTARRAAAGA
jgi:hypothetical protein